MHDGSDEVLQIFPYSKDGISVNKNRKQGTHSGNTIYSKRSVDTKDAGYGSHGSAGRFFYSAKANKQDRAGSKHPTVKPVNLMQYLVRLVTPPGGKVLDMFAGSGTTGEAALREGFQPILIEREAEYVIDIKRRLSNVVRELENGGKHGKEAGSKKANSESIAQSSNESETSHKEACCESNGKSQRRRSRRDFRSLLRYVNSG